MLSITEFILLYCTYLNMCLLCFILIKWQWHRLVLSVHGYMGDKNMELI